MRPFAVLFSMLLCGQVDSPPLARVLDGEGRLTPIHGLAGNFIAGRPEAGPPLMAYSNDGDIEWRLERGRLSATRNGVTAVFATEATRAVFRGAFAVLPESNESLRLVGDVLTLSSDAPPTQLAGRLITWGDGKLRIFQADSAVEEIDCPQEPDSIAAAAAHWAHVVIAGRGHLLRLTAGRVEMFVLPLGGRR